MRFIIVISKSILDLVIVPSVNRVYVSFISSQRDDRRAKTSSLEITIIIIIQPDWLVAYLVSLVGRPACRVFKRLAALKKINSLLS